MDRFVKGFIAMSMFYLVSAGIVGVVMLAYPQVYYLKFAHSHLMLLGWVSMMIYGVGYHILPRFAGKLIKNTAVCEVQFVLANIGLIGMVVTRALGERAAAPGGYRVASAAFGAMEVVALVLFFYTMAVTIFMSHEEVSSQ